MILIPGWKNSSRKMALPSTWLALREQVLARDARRCTWIENGERCAREATDVDHIKRGDDHSLKNLRALCSPHHRRKSSSEGGSARWAKRKKLKREEPPHPGLLPRPRRDRGA